MGGICSVFSDILLNDNADDVVVQTEVMKAVSQNEIEERLKRHLGSQSPSGISSGSGGTAWHSPARADPRINDLFHRRSRGSRACAQRRNARGDRRGERCARDLVDLPDDMATKIDVQFYKDARDALLKAMVE